VVKRGGELTMRQRLPNRRGSDLMQVEHAGSEYTVTSSRDAHGRVAEVFIDTAKAGSAMRDLMRDAAVIASIALQHGVPLSEMVASLTREADGRLPSTPVGSCLAALLDPEA
jgi:hypothetical protein